GVWRFTADRELRVASQVVELERVIWQRQRILELNPDPRDGSRTVYRSSATLNPSSNDHRQSQ
ncbi:hypothetical protein P692DRAFT_201798682, partial [Suillus brevipes Sb2]